MTKHYISFLKVGQRSYMEELVDKGIVYCKPIRYFTQIETDDLQGDSNEGVGYIQQLSNLEVTVEGNLLGTASKAQIFFSSRVDHGNIYCLYGIETSTIDIQTKKLQQVNLNMDSITFGDSAVLIYQPGEFIRRVRQEVKSRGLKFHYHPVQYYDPSIYGGKLGPFFKSIKYSEQKEIRFWIPNKMDTDLVFEIGNISDISRLISKEDIKKIGYEPF